MSETTEVKIGGKSQEEVALYLMEAIFKVEGKIAQYGGYTDVDRDGVLSAYRECLRAVRNPFQD